MRLLTFQAARFGWKSEVLGLPELADPAADDSVRDAVVAFVHAEPADVLPATRERTLRHALKHVKWLANKRGLRNVVLHSFTHLGSDHAPPAFAKAWLAELAAKLTAGRYEVKQTPFGWSCAWELAVFGESLAKVWKEIGAGAEPAEPTTAG
ncbi:MAG: hypothetical protein FJ293_03095 [Planctomycetes bacterium]|nr:hypothetical protein [Planctomycetota bacterium]